MKNIIFMIDVKVDGKEGLNTIVFDKDNLIKGMYIYSIQIENQVISKRLIIR